MEYFPHILLGILLTGFILHPLTTFFHELGHAAVSLLLSRKGTDIYIGSLGEPNGSFHFKVGRLGVWISYNPLKWNRGLCRMEEELKFWEKVAVIIAGPAASFLLCMAALVITFAFDAHGALKFGLVIFMMYALLDLFINLSPSTMPVALYGGSTVYNDGQLLKELFRYRKHVKRYDMLENKEYVRLERKTLRALKRNPDDEYMIRIMVDLKCQTEEYEVARDYFSRLSAHHPHTLSANDHVLEAELLNRLGKKEEALKAFDAAIEKEPDHAVANNNKGYDLSCGERFAEALPYLEKAVAMAPDMAFAYNNRGHAKLMTGDEEGGLADILRSLEMDAGNAFAYRNLGIYHLRKGDAGEALKQFRKAEELDAERQVPMLRELIAQAKSA